ncbi:hypothetical protein GF312_00690 [Candidatus Poribacteria bacterium]|nr:hypothetical protein [Candidatus Poribacteria bacterium]
MTIKPKTRLYICLMTICLILFAFVSYSPGVTTTVWEQRSHRDFNAGKPVNVSISGKNQVILSRELISIQGEIPELSVWCLAQDSKGNIYAGTGDNGKLFKITPSGEASLLFDSPETDIFSLAVDEQDNIYAGTSPDGLIYKIKPDRVPETFFTSGENYIWAMVFDDMGNLYAGTGINGKIYTVSPDGKGEEVYDSSDTHIKSLLKSGKDIYAGTEGNGIIYKISQEGKIFVVYDTSKREICSMVSDEDDNIYVAAASGETQPSKDEPSSPNVPRTGRSNQDIASSIYSITPDGVVKRIWRCPEPLIHSITMDDGILIAGTGDNGKIYSITTDGEWALIADSEESQVLDIHKSSATGELWIATGNSGKIHKLSPDYIKEGTLESRNQDASIISKWGKIWWESNQPEGTDIVFSTRSGNTEKPDDTWSDWSQDYIDDTGSTITSPPARFIQWKAKLTSDDGKTTPVLNSVMVAYLQKNLKPRIAGIRFSSGNERNEGPPGPPGGGNEESGKGNIQEAPLKGTNDIKWQSRDPNGDSMEYSIYFRGTEEKNWKLLKEELRDTSHSLDTESLPDGTYLLKIVATDSPDNPDDMALTTEEISDPFYVDNTSPVISQLEVESVVENIITLTGKVEDAGSYVKKLSYSVDGKDWKMILPSDQILDSSIEIFSIKISELKSGEHTIAIKASDATGNISTEKTVTNIE